MGMSKRFTGAGIVEVVVGLSILAVVSSVLFGLAINAIVVADDASAKARAANLLEEGEEAVRIMRYQGWNTISTPVTNYYLRINSGVFLGCFYNYTITQANSNTVNGACPVNEDTKFVRKISITDPVGDLNVREYAITVEWTDRRGKARSEQVKFQLTNHDLVN